jgi:hypothetical protein
MEEDGANVRHLGLLYSRSIDQLPPGRAVVLGH